MIKCVETSKSTISLSSDDNFSYFAYWGFVWALLSSSRYMQFNMAGLRGERSDAGRRIQMTNLPGITEKIKCTLHNSRCQSRDAHRPRRHWSYEDRRMGRFGTWLDVSFLSPWGNIFESTNGVNSSRLSTTNLHFASLTETFIVSINQQCAFDRTTLFLDTILFKKPTCWGDGR